MVGVWASASSAICFKWMCLPDRSDTLAVTSALQSESLIRSRKESALNPPNTTEWIAPIRAQASVATASSTTIGM